MNHNIFFLKTEKNILFYFSPIFSIKNIIKLFDKKKFKKNQLVLNSSRKEMKIYNINSQGKIILEYI